LTLNFLVLSEMIGVIRVIRVIRVLLMRSLSASLPPLASL
jgi:hypothetical protein